MYILEPEVLEQIPSGQHYMFEKGLFPRLLEIGKPVYGYHLPGILAGHGDAGKIFFFKHGPAGRKISSPLSHMSREGSVFIMGRMSQFIHRR